MATGIDKAPEYSLKTMSTSTTTTIKTGAGVMHSLVITNTGATSNSIKIYDNTAASGKVILDLSTSGGLPAVGTTILDATFDIGLTIITAGTTPPQLTVTYL